MAGVFDEKTNGLTYISLDEDCEGVKGKHMLLNFEWYYITGRLGLCVGAVCVSAVPNPTQQSRIAPA